MKVLAALILLGGTASAAPAVSGRIVLLPIDDRPAVGQFARMIGAVAGVEVVMPPPGMLGRFTRPADTGELQRWLGRQDYARVDALVVSVDMLAYGGLISSRTHGVALDEALRRLEFFRDFRGAHPGIPVYAFGVIMRVAPTADARTRAWRDELARWAELQDRVRRSNDAALRTELESLAAKIPGHAIADYEAARRRNLQVNLAAIDLLEAGELRSLILLQDDARLYGLHRRDQEEIEARLRKLGLEEKVPVYNGADEGSLSLVSRAALEARGQPVRVFPRFSGRKSRDVIAPYEDRPLEFTVASQIGAAGSVPVEREGEADYKLFVNAPGTSDAEFEQFLDEMCSDLRKGKRVALADVLFPAPHRSGADERVVSRLEKEDLVDRLEGYAAWNTAGNTLGTAIPHANMRVLASRRRGLEPETAARAAAAHHEFLLHRFAGDYLYHDIVRPAVNGELRARGNTAADELAPEVYEWANRRTQERLRPLIEAFFDRHFRGRKYAVPGSSPDVFVRILALDGTTIRLPWPRTFEVMIEYRMSAERSPD